MYSGLYRVVTSKFGGLFEKDEDEIELAFRIAVDRVNTDENLLPNSRMVALVEKLHSDNSVLTSKTSCSLLHKGIAALFGPQSDLTSMHIQSICDDFEIPHIEARWEYRFRRDQLSINLYPHPTVISRAFIRLIHILDWHDFFLLYEDDTAIVRMKEILEEGEKENWDIHIFQFSESLYREKFQEIMEFQKSRTKQGMPDYRIVLDVPGDKLWKVLKAAQQVGMMTEYQNYIIAFLDLHTIDLSDFQYGMTNITSLRLVQEESQEFQSLLNELNLRLLLVRDKEPLKTLKTETVLMYDSVKQLAIALDQMDNAKNIAVFPPISCSLMNKGTDGTTIYNYMKDGKAQGLSGLIAFNSEGFRSYVTFDVMHLKQDGLSKIGTIFPDQEPNVTTPEGTSLEHSHFRVTTILTDPYAMYAESSKQMVGNARFEGYGIDLLNALAETLHFTYDINVVRDEQYGRKNETGHWSGMIGELIRGEADMAVADLTITTTRLEAVDFTHPFMQTGIGILFKKPTQKVHSMFSFLQPFSGEVWLFVMVVYIIVSLVCCLIGRLSPYEWSNPHPCRDTDMVEENVFSLLNSMWLTIGAFMRQGSDIAPTAMSTRAIKSIWGFFCLIMISSYTANLAAFLTIEKLVSPINNVEDLASQDKIKYGCLKSGSTRDFFQNSDLPIYQHMNRYMREHPEVYVESNELGIQRVAQGNYAYLMEITSIEYKTERICNLTRIGTPLDSKGYGIAVQKGNLKLSNWLSSGILKLQEEGELHLIKERWWKQKKGGGQCSGVSKSSGSANELGLGNVGGVFVVILLGLGLSACIGVIEFIWYQRKVHKDIQVSMFNLLIKEVKYAITCGSSTKPAPKLKSRYKIKTDEERPKALKSNAPFK
ncbi:glutamate receptor ionotropic, kainate 2 isoform X2 [Parasteatoda tepidariorum]|uniref:glutamate receptor ionotropic, kainate 2 isoform X2 n=1 Tax=Parasteatoda tepidariorum TaxID=114398 RepID=UPI001C7236D2|nr:glutamate receptor ionotropic, kainate 2-like isoform X2 [Parasteatoda tepidariorum]